MKLALTFGVLNNIQQRTVRGQPDTALLPNNITETGVQGDKLVSVVKHSVCTARASKRQEARYTDFYRRSG